MSINFNFIPIKNSTWQDLTNWLEQSSPKEMVFLSRVLNYIKILSGNFLPHASAKNGFVIFTWDHGDRIFVMKVTKSLIHPENAHVLWEIHDANKNLLHQGEYSEASWLPEAMVYEFGHHLEQVKSKNDLIFLSFFMVFVVFTFGLIFFQI